MTHFKTGARRRDTHTMFAVYYESGDAAYIRINPLMLRGGDHVAAVIARARQQSGEIAQGTITRVKRVK